MTSKQRTTLTPIVACSGGPRAWESSRTAGSALPPWQGTCDLDQWDQDSAARHGPDIWRGGTPHDASTTT
ncbi:hypothetical protein NHJ6243_001207 [Beauveria neobassiana]